MIEIKRRFELYNKCSKDEKLAAAEYYLCKKDIFHFIKNWCFTFDPRLKVTHQPFILYPFQIDAINWLEDRYKKKEVGIIEKSRDMGATWLIVTWALHKWIFEDSFTCLFGSKTESDVDSASIDSIFGKIRYQLYRLPQFLRPDMKVKINEKRDADSYLSIINPVTGNEISGDSANENFGRSGRRSAVFLDEYAFVDQSEKIWSAISEVSNVIIPVSTPNGKGNHFYTLRNKGTIPLLSLHWSKHPNKNQNWYENKRLSMEEWQVAQELDISYNNSKVGRVYKGFKREVHVASNVIEINPSFEQFCTMDFGVRDMMVIIFGQIDVMNNVEIFAEFDCTDFDIELFIHIMRGNKPPSHLWHLLDEYKKKEIVNVLRKVFKDSSCINLDRAVFGDHAGSARSANSVRSIRDRLKSEGGFDLITSSRQDFANRIQCLGNLFKLKKNLGSEELTTRFKVSPDCPKTIDALLNYVWAKDENSSNQKPKHDQFSHHVTALEFFAINRFSIMSTGKVEIEKVR